jgi:hypothetical protein
VEDDVRTNFKTLGAAAVGVIELWFLVCGAGVNIYWLLRVLGGA